MIATVTSTVIDWEKAFSIEGSKRIVFFYEDETEAEHLVNCSPHWRSVRGTQPNIGSSSKAVSFVTRMTLSDVRVHGRLRMRNNYSSED